MSRATKKHTVCLSFLLFVILALLTPGSIAAETKTLTVTQDTYANQAYPDKVNGTFGSVVVSNKYTTRLGYFMFENPNLPTGALVDNATLKLYFQEVHYADTAKINVGPVTENWVESSVTFNDQPTINQSQATEATLSITDPGWKEVGVTDLVKKWNDGSQENFGLFVYPFGFLYGTAETEFAFSAKSREAGDSPAEIVINFHLEESPTPTSEEAAAATTSPEANPSITPTLTPTPPSLHLPGSFGDLSGERRSQPKRTGPEYLCWSSHYRWTDFYRLTGGFSRFRLLFCPPSKN